MSIREVWSQVKNLSKPRRQLLVIVPNRNYLVELCAHAFDECDTRRMVRRGLLVVLIRYEDRDMKVMVGAHHGEELVCRTKEQLMGRRDQDIVICDPVAMGAKLKHEMQCLSATFDAQFSVVVDK
nr:hypothetical protein K9PH25C2_LOCUS16 [Klebsiella phage vB_Kpn_K9PH25C2]